MKSPITPYLALSLCLAFAGGSRIAAPAIAAPAIAAESAAQPLKPFTAKTLRFSIDFPGKPTVKHEKLPTPYGPVQANAFTSDSELLTYIVVAAVSPNVGKLRARDVMDGMQKGLLRSANATLLASRPVSLGRIPGRELQLSMQGGSVLARVNLYFTPKISYQVMAAGKKENFQAQKAEVAKVIGSFRIAAK